MSKWAFNYDSGEYEDIDRDGFSWTGGNIPITGMIVSIDEKKRRNAIGCSMMTMIYGK